MLRANAEWNNLQLLFPMITTVEEVDEALRLLEQAHEELQEDGWPTARPTVGAVSYTHLDVYKRQFIICAVLLKSNYGLRWKWSPPHMILM